MTLAEVLGAFAADLRFEALPADVVERVRLHSLDVLGVCLATAQFDFARILKAVAAESGGARESTLFGAGMKRPATAAALYNGGLAHGNEFDDTYAPGRWHGSAPTVPPALAVAEALHRDGRSFIVAVAAGLEVGCRLTRAAPGLLSRGFHSTCTAGVFSAALAVGKLMRLAPEQLANTLGICGSFAAGTMEYLNDPEPWSKRIQVGHAAASAIVAARAAAHGFRAPRTIFEGQHGYFRSYAGDGNFDLSRVTEALGKDWQLLHLYPKRYPCDHIAQGYVDCAIAFFADGVRVPDIQRAVCIVHPLAARIMFEPREVRYRPGNGWSARWSMPFSVAVALADGALTLDSYSDVRTSDPEILALMDRVVPDEDASLAFPADYPAWLRLELKDGRALERKALKVAGSAENPMPAAEYDAKFFDTARRAIGASRATQVLGLGRRLTELSDMAELAAACG